MFRTNELLWIRLAFAYLFLVGGGQGGHNLPPPVPFCPFVSRLPPFIVFLPLSCKWRCLTPYSDSIRSALVLFKIKKCVVKNCVAIRTLRRTSTWPCYDSDFTVHQRHLYYYNIGVAHKPITTLRRLLTKVKDKDKPEDKQGAVYKIKCCDCQASYIGETGRNLSTRLTEHKKVTRNGDVNNHIAEHHLQTKHNWLVLRLLSTSYFRKLVY